MKEENKATPVNSKGGVWVKATLETGLPDRLKEPEKQYFIKYFTTGWEKEVGGRNYMVDLLENGWPEIFYLDETSTPISVGAKTEQGIEAERAKAKELVEGLEKIKTFCGYELPEVKRLVDEALLNYNKP